MQGKSTLVNRLLGSQRMLTGAEAGLTRDANTTALQHGRHRILLTDTAGWLQHSQLGKADPFGCDAQPRCSMDLDTCSCSYCITELLQEGCFAAWTAHCPA